MRAAHLALAVAGYAAMFPPHPVAAQPAPPPPPGFPDYVRLLDDAYNMRDIAAFGDLFQPDVKVFQDGSLIAADLPSYLKIIKSEFESNLHLLTVSWAQGSQIMVMRKVTGCIPDRPQPNIVHHGCQWTVAVRYDLDEHHKIASVHILTAERAWNMHPPN
jgi:hypothetical protein